MIIEITKAFYFWFFKLKVNVGKFYFRIDGDAFNLVHQCFFILFVAFKLFRISFT